MFLCSKCAVLFLLLGFPGLLSYVLVSTFFLAVLERLDGPCVLLCVVPIQACIVWSPTGIVGEIEEGGENYYIWTHKKFDIGVNGNQVVDVNLTSETKVKLKPGSKMEFSYEASMFRIVFPPIIHTRASFCILITASNTRIMKSTNQI